MAQKEIQGQTFILVGFSAYPNLYTDDKLEFVSKLAQQYGAMLIVNIHWGDEYQLHSNKAQQEFARKLIDSGADLIIGHHPHVVQEVEPYTSPVSGRSGYIVYSLGNFLFGLIE